MTTEFAKVSFQARPPAIFIRVILPPSSEELLRFRTDFLSLTEIALKENGILYSIVDATNLQLFSFELLLNYLGTFRSQPIEGFRVNAIVKSKSVNAIPVNLSIDINHTHIEVFDTLCEAQERIEADWSRVLLENEKLIN